MKSRNPKILFHGGLAALFMTGVILSGCTENASVQTPNEQDLEVATQVMASTLSDQDDGVVASMYDATSVATPSGMEIRGSMFNMGNNGPAITKQNGPMHGRFNDYQYTYDPVTGIHYITFTRDMTRKNIEKTLSAELQFIYRDSLGNFIEHPRLDFQSVGSVDFIGKKTGSFKNMNRNSTFTRIDTLFYTNLQLSSDVITINGNHNGEGEMAVSSRSGSSSVQRKYKISLEFSDLNIAKSSIINQDLEQGVTGTINYSIYIYHDVNGDVVENTFSGTVVMTGDGTALLNFHGWRPQYLIKLATGDVTLR